MQNEQQSISIVKFKGLAEPVKGKLVAFDADGGGEITYAEVTSKNGSMTSGYVDYVETENVFGDGSPCGGA